MQPVPQQFEFHGKAGEFFKIWIVNILLSIVTLGIYSAWAKVRTRRYFYNNTLLMNSPFDYLADPVKILKGRLLVFAVVIVYAVAVTLLPEAEAVMILLFIPLFPWIVIRALKFNWYNSAYRNIRFHFNGEYLKALWVFVGLPILTAFSIGLAYPYFTRARKQYVIDNSAYGTTGLELTAATNQFYSVYGKAFLVVLVTLLLLGSSILAVPVWKSFGIQNDSFNPLVPFFALFLIYPILMIVYGYVYTAITNLVVNHTSLDPVRFESNLETTKFCWLYFSNALAILFSLGLLIPWAMIRTARYRIACLTLIANGDLDHFFAAEAERTEAIGEEIGDFLDIDIGL
ncbi:MAG: YjgN family protein [Gammaproteobacteria bacterium]